MTANVRQRTLAHLQGLYTIVVSISLAFAVESIIDEGEPFLIRWSLFPFFLAYLFTLVPLYHGALIHLDITYTEDAENVPKSGALMIDWVLLFVESCLLLALAILVKRPEGFLYALCAFLFFDAVWSFVAYLVFSRRSRMQNAEKNWSIINFIASTALILTAIVLYVIDSSVQSVESYRWMVKCFNHSETFQPFG